MEFGIDKKELTPTLLTTSLPGVKHCERYLIYADLFTSYLFTPK